MVFALTRRRGWLAGGRFYSGGDTQNLTLPNWAKLVYNLAS